MTNAYAVHFTVEGIGEFPIDMLRYDQAFPADAEDALRIGLSEPRCIVDADGHRRVEPRRVDLISIVCYRFWQPTVARWQSFGWTVVQTGSPHRL